MKALKILGVLAVRFLISSIFLASGMAKLFSWREQEMGLMNTLSDWQTFSSFYEPLQDFFSWVIPWTPLLLMGATFLEFTGGFLLLLGIKERLGAFLLIVFLVPTTILMHQFWFLEGLQREVEISHFLKNLAILGGLFMVVLNGLQENGQEVKLSPMKFG